MSDEEKLKQSKVSREYTERWLFCIGIREGFRGGDIWGLKEMRKQALKLFGRRLCPSEGTGLEVGEC